MTETFSSPTFTFSKTSLVYSTALNSGVLWDFTMDVEDHSQGGLGRGMCCVSFPLWNAKGTRRGGLWVPKKMWLTLRANSQRRIDLWAGSAILAETEPQMSGSTQTALINSASEPHCSESACSEDFWTCSLVRKTVLSCLWTTNTGDSGLTMWK